MSSFSSSVLESYAFALFERKFDSIQVIFLKLNSFLNVFDDFSERWSLLALFYVNVGWKLSHCSSLSFTGYS